MESNPEPRPRRDRSGALWGGVILISLGIIFLLESIGDFSLHNWWALFILIPAFSSLGTAIALAARGRGFSYPVRGSLFGGLVTLLVAIMFLFELSWSIYWPLFVVIPAVGVMLSAFRLGARDQPPGFAMHYYRPWAGWIGFSAALFGSVYLLRNLGIFRPEGYLIYWWAVFLLIPAVGGLVSTILLVHLEGFGLWTVAYLVIVLSFGVVGVIALLGLNWNLLSPILLIAIGIIMMVSILLRQ